MTSRRKVWRAWLNEQGNRCLEEVSLVVIEGEQVNGKCVYGASVADALAKLRVIERGLEER